MKKEELVSVILTLFMGGGALLARYEEETRAPDIEVRGRIICLDESRKEAPCTDNSNLFGFLTSTGERYYFMPDDVRAQMFKDSRIRARELIVKGRLRPQRQVEITKVWSVKDGQKFDIYYFCPICNIKAHVGGLCWCCQQEFELREEPVN